MTYFFYFALSLSVLNYVASELFKSKTTFKELLGFLVLEICIVTYVNLNDLNTILMVPLFSDDFLYLFKVVFSMAIEMYYLHINYEAPMEHKFATIVTAYVISIIGVGICESLYLDLNGVINFSNLAHAIIIIIASNISSYLIWFILTKAIKELVQTRSLISLPLILLPFATIVLIIYLMRTNNASEMNLIMILIIILANYIIIYFYSKNISKLRTEMLNKKMEVEINYYREKLELETENYNRSFAFVHDMIYKIKDIKKAIDNDDQHKLNCDVDDLHNKLLKEFNILFTNSKTLSVVLNNHIAILAENNIDIKTNLRCADFTFMEDIEITKILEFLLDYAIDYCKKSNDNNRFININSFNKNENFVIKYIFNCDHNDLKYEDFNDIAKIVDKYHGHIFIDYDDDENYATVSILFRIVDISEYISCENKIN